MHPLEIFLYKKVFNTENGVIKQLKMREIKVEEDKEEIAQTVSVKWLRLRSHQCDFPAAGNARAGPS